MLFVIHCQLVKNFIDKNNLRDLRSKSGECLKIALEHFNEFCKRQGINTHFNDKLSLSLWGKVDAKVAYLANRCSFTRINFQTPMIVYIRKYEKLLLFEGCQNFDY